MKLPALLQRTTFAVLGISLLSSCANGPAASTTIDSKFTAIQAQILNGKCLSCHSTHEAKGGFSVSSYAEIMSSPGAVSPFAPGSSSLYQLIVDGSMPRESRHLGSDEIQAIYSWIIQGAKND